MTHAGGLSELFINATSAGTTTYTETGSGFITGYSLGYDIDASTAALRAARRYSGQIAEVIAFNRTVSVQERERIQSYLAIKYGITLPVTAINYYDSAGNIVYNLSDDYVNDIVGIGRDDDQGLSQRTRVVILVCLIVILYCLI